MLKILLSMMLCFIVGLAYAQVSTDYVKQINNLALRIDTSQGQGNLIVDGIIEKRSKTWLHKKTRGAYTETYYYNPELKKLNKVSYETSLNNAALEEYYFFNDSLVMLKTIQKDNITGKITIKKLYFKNNRVVKAGSESGPNTNYFLKKAWWYISNFNPDILNAR